MSSLDRAVNNDFLMISKTLLPYLQPDRQKPLAIFIKTIELMSTIDIFSREDVVRSMSRSHEGHWEKDFLRDLRKNLSGDRGYFIDAILKLSEVRDLLASHNMQDSSTHTAYTGDQVFLEPEEDLSNPAGTTTTTASPPPPPSPTSNPASSGINPADIIDKLSSVLEPNQVQVLKILSSFIK